MQVRAAVSEFRDSRREAIVRARNRLFATVIFSGISGYTFLFLAILSGAWKTRDRCGVRLLPCRRGGRARQATAVCGDRRAAAQDDYGLGIVRLIQTPLLAGLAAIGGVVLVELAARGHMTLV